MNLETYKRAMAEFGINRGGFEPDAEFDHQAGITDVKEPMFTNAKASTKPERTPMQPVAEHLQCKNPVLKNAGSWWTKLSPKERKKHSRQRSENGKMQGRHKRKAASFGALAPVTK